MGAASFLSSSWYRVAGLRPRLREHVSISRHRYRGRSWYVLHDQASGRAHRLSTATYMIVGGMDGARTVDQLWRDTATRLGQEAPSQDELIGLMAQLHSADLLQSEVTPDAAELLERAEKMDRSRWLGNVVNPLAMRLRFWHPDKFFERTLPLVNWLVGWQGALLWLVVVMPAIVLALQHWHELSENASDRILAADNIFMMALSFVVLKALHELGHGYSVKAFGGTVHEIGVMFLVFAPMPYVDASAASEFRNKWSRALVGAAGMIVEVFIAALALYVWLTVEQGVVRALAFNVMAVAGASTVLFNANPLLRYDGYYILSDLLEIPNLAQRASRCWGHVVDKYVFRTEGLSEFVATPGERIWLLFYAPASFAYRVLVVFAVALFVASQYLAVGVAIAIWGLLTGVALPIGKALWHVFASPRLQRNRARAAIVTSGSVLGLVTLLFAIPAPHYTTTEGVVWLPESANVRAGTSGFVRRLLADPGSAVPIGEALIESEEPTLSTEIDILQARAAELETRLVSERFSDRVQAQMTMTELGQVHAELATAAGRVERLTARSLGVGVFTVINPQDLPGRFFKEGQLIAYVLPEGSRIVRATVGQDDIDLVRNRLRRVFVKLAERMDENLPGRIVREVPAGRDDLPSKALGGTGGGALPVDPRDPQGTKTLQRIFQVDIELPSQATSAAVFGSRAYVRFEHSWEPIGQQIWRRARQLVLTRLQA
jgi:putative peptide zinc metalloprotease protein